MKAYWIFEWGRQENATSSEVKRQSSKLNCIDLEAPEESIGHVLEHFVAKIVCIR